MKLLLSMLLALQICIAGTACASVSVMTGIGTYVVKPDLATFAISADCKGKTAIIATPQSVTTAVVIPADRSVEFQRGGMITTTGIGSVTFQGAISVPGGDYQIFSPTSSITLNGANWGNPRWWGAKGDAGTNGTDDGAALQAALTAGKTRWTSGQYLTGRTLTARYDIVFDDWQTTAIIARSGVTLNPVLMITANSPNSVAVQTFKNLHVGGTRSAAHQSGIFFKQGTGVGTSIAILDIQNIRVYGMNGFGVKFDTVWDSTISNVHTEDCGSTVFSEAAAWFGSTTGDSFNQNTVSGIQFERSVYQAMNVDTASYSNRFFGMHIEATTNLGTDIILGGYRNQYYGAGHLGANHRYIYVGGESNVYDGLFLETAVRDANLNPGNVYRMNSCVMPSYDGNGGAGYAQLSNCTIGTFTANGQEMKLVSSDIGTLVYSFMSVGLHISGGSIGDVTGTGTLGYLELTGPVRFKNAVLLKNTTYITQAIFDSNLTLNYTIGSKIDSTSVGGTLALEGNTSAYTTKVTNCNIANLWVDTNQQSVISGSTITGTATEAAGGTASKLNQCTVAGAISGFTIGQLSTGATAATPAVKDNSLKIATTQYADRIVATGSSQVGAVVTRFDRFNTGATEQHSIASFFLPNGSNPKTAVINTNVFTADPYCVLTPAGSNPAITGAIESATYNAGTGQVTVIARLSDTATGAFVLCHGR